jgi:hypothetical protein
MQALFYKQEYTTKSLKNKHQLNSDKIQIQRGEIELSNNLTSLLFALLCPFISAISFK